MARYRLLADHFINNAQVYAGTIVTVGVEVPMYWVPTVDVEPLDFDAAVAYYYAGPRMMQGLIRAQWVNNSVSPPATYWKAAGPNVWGLTGIGAGFPLASASIGRIE
jgi:hypothetical protein